MSEEVDAVVNHMFLYFLIFSIILGAFGNLLNFIIFTSSASRMRKHSMSIYFRTIAIFDTIMLVETSLYFVHEMFNYDIAQLNGFFCKTSMYFLYSTGAISPWLMVIVSVDRFLSIRFGRRFSLIFKTSFKISIICGIVVYCYLLYSFTTWNTELISYLDSSKCCLLI